MKIAVLAMVLAVASAQTVIPLVNKIDVVYIKTADCDGCGMTDGQVGSLAHQFLEHYVSAHFFF